MNKPQVYARYKNVRVSPKKAGLVVNLVRGKDVDEAVTILKFDNSKSAAILLKALKTALSNTNAGTSDLFISDVYVDGGSTFKRGRFVGRGHVSPILKRTSNITIGLSLKERKDK